MKTPFFFILGLLLCCGATRAQQAPASAAADSIVLSYTYPASGSDMRNLLDFLDVRNLKVSLKGDFSNDDAYLLHRYVCREGVITDETDKLPDWLAMRRFERGADSITIEFYARSLSPDSVQVGVVGFNRPTIALSNDPDFILMETLSERPYRITDEIPVMAYTTGICKKSRYEGIEGKTIDYCALRFAATHPREWFEKHGVRNYVYYTVTFR